MDYWLFSGSLVHLPVSRTLLINTINQYSFCIANRDFGFKKSLQASDILLPDGIAVVAAARFLTGRRIKKVAGYDMHEYLLNKLNISGGSCFYLGACDDTLQKIIRKMKSEFPCIRVAAYSPPYKAQFTDEDNRCITEVINAFQPDILFVGMTAPKQEKWAFDHKDLVNCKIICTIGAVFDFYAGTIERPGKFWIACGLEWFIRLTKEPSRLWKRYLYFGPVFIWLIIKEKAKLILNKAQKCIC